MRIPTKKQPLYHLHAEKVLGRPLTSLERVRGVTLRESRSYLEQGMDGSRKPVRVKPIGPLEAEARRLEKLARDERYLKLTPNARMLQDIREIQAQQSAKESPTIEHPRVSLIRDVIDRLQFDPNREVADLEFAELVLAQHAPDMDPQVANDWYDELMDREKRYLDAVEEVISAKRTALEAQLAELNSSRATLPVDSCRFNLLRAAVQRGLPLRDGEYEAIAAADNDPEAQAMLSAKYSSQISEYQAKVDSGEIQ